MDKNNLKPKCITDFNSEDTIYIKVKDNETFLCRFLEIKGRRIYGTMLMATVNEKLHSQSIKDEKIVSASLSNCALYGENPITKHTRYHWFLPSGYAIYPKDYNLENRDSEIIKEHPSFGMISLSRRQSASGVVLFGSSIQHRETMTLTISKASVDRNLSREWYHNREEVVEVEMSSSQFAEFITSPNTSGVPCTLKHVERKMIPEPPYESKKDMFSKEFENTMKNISTNMLENIDVLKSILSKKSINKGDKDEILDLFNEITSPLKNTIPFIETSFVEQMDRTVTEAKGEIESFISRRISEEGRKALLGKNGEILLGD